MRWTENDIKKLGTGGMASYKKNGIIKVQPKGKKSSYVKPLINEHELQCLCIDWFRRQFPFHAWHLFAIPNGGQRHAAVAAKLNKEGVLSGVFDLFLSLPRGGYSGMFIEMKVGRNKLSENQVIFMEHHKSEYKCVVCKTVEEFLNEITEYLIS